MADWIHCNGCFIQPKQGTRFFLTNCSHIFCQECIATENNAAMCKVCNKQCSTIPLAQQMKENVQKYFNDPSQTIQKQLQEIVNILNFQKTHRLSFVADIKQKLSKSAEMWNEYNKLVKYVKEMQSANHSLTESNQALVQENAYLKKLVNQNRPSSTSSSPASQYISGSAINFSRLGLNTPASSLTPPDTVHSQRTPNGSINTTSNSTVTPGRISMRTPPINGRMGIIPGRGPPSCPSLLQRCTTPTSGKQNTGSPFTISPTLQTSRHSSISKMVTETPVKMSPHFGLATPISSYSQYQHLFSGKSQQSENMVTPTHKIISLNSSVPSSLSTFKKI